MTKILLRLYSVVHALLAVLFGALALVLIAISAQSSWEAISHGLSSEAAVGLIESIGLLAVAVVMLQISQTIVEEEVIRDAHISAPTRVRRYLSRFLVVIIVALTIEGLVATMLALHQDLKMLPYAGASLLGTAALLIAWGVFLRMNAHEEELEPEAMESAKKEDAKFE